MQEILAMDVRLLSAGVVTVALGLHVLLGHFLRAFQRGSHRRMQKLRSKLHLQEGQRMTELSWVIRLLQLGIWLAVLVALLELWQLHVVSRSLLDAALSGGFQLGPMRIVPSAIFVGLVWFVLLVVLVRWLRRRLSQVWLARSQMETATRESVATLFGYTGFVIALLVALQTAGMDFSKLALVAGGLSVGIGFGLREIANNFVSGLILLFEKPIRTGDYITVAPTEGFVRKIRIRSTEIVDWNRESIIVPNSLVLQAHVRNLNLRDDYGRACISVPVAHGSDTELVKRLLLETAAAHAETLAQDEVPEIPGPLVLFMAFNESDLRFELRVFVRDVTRRLLVCSDLRFAIDEVLRANGVRVPFPQRDIWLRGDDAPPTAGAALAPPPPPPPPRDETSDGSAPR